MLVESLYVLSDTRARSEVYQKGTSLLGSLSITMYSQGHINTELPLYVITVV